MWTFNFFAMSSPCMMQCVFSISVIAIFIFQIKRTITVKTLKRTHKKDEKFVRWNCTMHTYWSRIITILLCYEHQSVLLACTLNAFCAHSNTEKCVYVHASILLLCPFFGKYTFFPMVTQKCQWIQKTPT